MMNVLFVIRSAQIYHYYESIVAALGKRGHRVTLLFDKDWTGDEYIADVGQPFEWAHVRSGWERRILFAARELLSYRRYLLIKYQSSFYAERWLKYVSPKMRFFIKRVPGVQRLIKTNIVGALLRLVERLAPPDHMISEDIKRRAPDVVLATPVNFRQSSSDLEYIKAAKFLGIPTAVPVISWDNLTTKGIFHAIPDLLLVWNKEQQEEAWAHHGISADKTAIVGAPFFDKWFTHLTPSLSREDFAQKFDFSAQDSVILYLGSSDNIAPDERRLIIEMRNALDVSRDERIKNTQIIFRPHPANYKVYKDFSLPKVFVQKGGVMPKDAESLQDFYNLLFYSEAVVSINTSGMVDAIIAGRPVISFERKEFSTTQVLAQHYRHMRQSNALYVTKTPQEFLEIFSKLLLGEDFKKPDREKFIRDFVRPRGIDKSAGEVVAQETEALFERSKNV